MSFAGAIDSSDPFEVLEVPPDADAVAIRAAYLRAVRRWPPEREPERFKQVRGAYDALSSDRTRLQKRYFMFRAPPLPELPAPPVPERIEISDQELVQALILAHLIHGRRLLSSRPAAPSAGASE